LRKQIRHTPNLRYTARGRPHSRQRDSRRDENFGVRIALAIFDLLATVFDLSLVQSHLARGASRRFNFRFWISDFRLTESVAHCSLFNPKSKI
jgi:hypothetical protein